MAKGYLLQNLSLKISVTKDFVTYYVWWRNGIKLSPKYFGDKADGKVVTELSLKFGDKMQG